MGSAQERILKWTPISRKLDSVKEKNLKWLKRTIMIKRQKTVGFQKRDSHWAWIVRKELMKVVRLKLVLNKWQDFMTREVQRISKDARNKNSGG